jgi:predicted phage terminase large subunit-like protein
MGLDLVHAEEVELNDAIFATAAELAVEAAREDLLAFIMLMDPEFSVAPHHRVICDALMRIEANESKRMMLFVPPRSSKSLIGSVYFPAWCIGRSPGLYVIEASHNTSLAVEFGRTVRDMTQMDIYKSIFPEVTLRSDNKSADNWKTTNGGRFKSAGVGTGIAGSGAHVGIIDDPLSEQDAWSQTAREKVNSWYPGGFRSRLMPKTGRVVLINTRWHEGDLSGVLETKMYEDPQSDQWEIIRIPALNDTRSLALLLEGAEKLKAQGYLPEDWPDPVLGETFWPAPEDYAGYHWSSDELISTKHNLPSYQWNALYMQNPSAEDGGILKKSYWRIWKNPLPPECDIVIASVDTAFSQRERADYSAITIWGLFTVLGRNNLIMLSAKKGHWAYPDLRKNLMKSIDKYDPDTIIIENKASGMSLVQDLTMAGLPIFAFQPDRDKESRVHAITPIFAQGRVWVPAEKMYADEVIEECRQFPLGRHDDYVDTVSQALLWMRNGAYVVPPDNPWNDIDEDDIIERRAKRVYY